MLLLPGVVVFPGTRRQTTTTTATTRVNNNNNSIAAADTNNNDGILATPTDDDTTKPLMKDTDQPSYTIPSRKPPHASSIESKLTGNGLVSFRHTLASKEQKENNDDETKKQRAKVLSRVLTLNNTTTALLPSRGKVIVVSLSAQNDNLECSQLHRILYLLATYFTVIVVLMMDNVDKSDKIVRKEDPEVTAAKNKLYSSSVLTPSILPEHRMVAVRSHTGKIALVRQLGSTVDFVLDYESETRVELERFGFRVIVYNSAAKNTTLARLSNQLKVNE